MSRSPGSSAAAAGQEWLLTGARLYSRPRPVADVDQRRISYDDTDKHLPTRAWQDPIGQIEATTDFKVFMRALWWALKLCAGLTLVGCLLSLALALVFPELVRSPGAWLGVASLSTVVYWIADAKLGSPARLTPVSHWRGDLYVVPAPLLRQGGLCMALAGMSLGIPLALVRGGELLGWQQGVLCLGALLSLWLCRASVIGYLHLRRAGYALMLDASGVHYPGLPLLPWTHISGMALNPPRPDSERSQCLVLQMRVMPRQPSGLHALWRAALPGASITRRSVSLPLPAISKSAVLLDAAQTLWHRYGRQPTGAAAPAG